MPLQGNQPHRIELADGVRLEVRPIIDGQSISCDHLFAFWAGGRSWRKENAITKTGAGTLVFPTLKPGNNSLILVRMENDHATHFSRITEVDLSSGKDRTMDEFAKRYREGHNKRDPELLQEAFATVADAFAKAGDLKESIKWQKKAHEQSLLIKEKGHGD